MKRTQSSFEKDIERITHFAGRELVEHGHPFFVPVDVQREIWANSGDPNPFASFAHYDYLGLNHHPFVVDASIAAIKSHGTSVGASRLVGGERAGHGKLESALAQFLGFDSTLTLVSGYLTNVTVINHLMGPRDLVIVDQLAHNSIVVGAKSGRFEFATFAHNDLDDLDAKLAAARSKYRRVLIVVEGLYSMDGDIPDLPRLVEIKNRHDAWLMVDEAHSMGVLGEHGRGICEHSGVPTSEIDLAIGTLSKAFVSSGGFICGKSIVIDYLRFTLPGFVYSVGLAPSAQASALAALTLIRDDPGLIAKLHHNSEYFAETARAAGLDIGTAIGRGVVPVCLASAEQTFQVSKCLLEAGVFAPPIVHIGVPMNQPRIRFFLSAGHTKLDIDRTIAIIASIVQDAGPSQETTLTQTLK